MITRRAALGTLGLALAAVPVALTAGGTPAWARAPDGDRTFLGALAETHALPRMTALAAAGGALVPPLEALCAAPDAAALEAARAAYGAVMDGWAGAQHLRPGPLLLETRNDRLAFWPERRNIVARQLGQLLAARDPKVLEPGAIARQSAAVQGLTALERLLFDEGVTPASFQGDDTARYRCALALAVGRNIAVLTGELRDGWRALVPKLAAGEATSVGATATEAMTNLYLSMVTMMQIVVDQKLLIPLGAGAGEAKPALAEAGRSGRSARAVALNLEAMRAMLLGENGGPGYAALLPDTADGRAARTAIADRFGQAVAAVRAVPVPLTEAVAGPQRPTVEAAFRAAKEAQSAVTRRLPPLLDIVLGFNELDGD